MCGCGLKPILPVMLFNVSHNNTFQSTAPVITVSSFTFPLVFVYFSLAFLAGVSIGRVLYFKHKFLSFQMAFLSLSLLWSLLRAAMFLFVDLFRRILPPVYQLLLWVPQVFQIATFSLVVVFYGLIVFRKKAFFVAFYVVLNVAFLLLHVVVYIVFFPAQVSMPHTAEEVGDSVTLALLALAICVIGVSLWFVMSDPEKGPPAMAKVGRQASQWKVTLFLVFVVMVLLTRAVANLLEALGVITPAFQSDGFTVEGGMWFFAYIMWEVVPICIFLVSFWPSNTLSGDPVSHVPKPHAIMSVNASMGDVGAAKEQQPLNINSNEETDALLSSNMFSNPARYDSDGEDSRFDAVGAIYSPYSTNSPIRAPQNLPSRGRRFNNTGIM